MCSQNIPYIYNKYMCDENDCYQIIMIIEVAQQE